MAGLVVTQGADRGAEYAAIEDVTLGRSPSSDIVLADRRASRRHSRIRRAGRSFIIEDLGSSNGTCVNGKRIAGPQRLNDGDTIRICDTVLSWQAPETAPKPFRIDSVLDGDQGIATQAVIDAQRSLVDVKIDAHDAAKAEQHQQRLAALCRIAGQLPAYLDLDELLAKTMDDLFETFPRATRGFVLLEEKEPEGQSRLVPAVTRCREGSGAEEDQEVRMSRTVVRHAMEDKQAVLCSDTSADDRFSDQVSIQNMRMRSFMCAPLLYQGEVLGLACLDTTDKRRPFTEDDLTFFSSICASAAMAVQNSRLVARIAKETDLRAKLSRFHSPGVVERMMKGELRTELGGELTRGTVFFSDIVGFTRMSESMSPEQVMDKLNRCYSVLTEVIFKHGGTIDKFGGDMIMAFWGVLDPREDDDARALAAAVEMQAALFDFNFELVAMGQTPIRMGVGLNSGEFVAGNLGGERKLEYTLIGDNVNLAQRLESKAGPGMVLVSEATYAAARESACAVRMPRTSFKGKSEPMHVYSVRGVVLPGEDGDILACLPVRVTGPGVEDGCPALISRARLLGQEAELELHAGRALQAASRYGLQLETPECPLPSFEAATPDGTVSGTATETSGAQQIFHASRLAAERLPTEVRSLLTPGETVPSHVEVDALQRA